MVFPWDTGFSWSTCNRYFLAETALAVQHYCLASISNRITLIVTRNVVNDILNAMPHLSHLSTYSVIRTLYKPIQVIECHLFYEHCRFKATMEWREHFIKINSAPKEKRRTSVFIVLINPIINYYLLHTPFSLVSFVKFNYQIKVYLIKTF